MDPLPAPLQLRDVYELGLIPPSTLFPHSRALITPFYAQCFCASFICRLVELKSVARSRKVSGGLPPSRTAEGHFLAGPKVGGTSHEHCWAASPRLPERERTDGDGHVHPPHRLHGGDLPAQEEAGEADREVSDGRPPRGGVLWQSERDAGLGDSLSQGC